MLIFPMFMGVLKLRATEESVQMPFQSDDYSTRNRLKEGRAMPFGAKCAMYLLFQDVSLIS